MSDPVVRENSQYYSPAVTSGSSGKINNKRYEKYQNGFIEDTGKKKQRKWSIGGLFRKKRNKSSDTDSSSELDDKRKGFLGRRKGGHRKGGSHKVVGKFERIVIPRNEPEKPTNNSSSMLNKLERYDSSPNAMLNRRHRSVTSNNSAKSNQEINDKSFECSSYGSLDTATKRNEKQKLKARVEAKRGKLADESSSDEYESSKNSNSSSLQRIQSDDNVMKYGSSSRRSRAARTDRYIKRHFKDDGMKNKEVDSTRSSGLSINSLPVKGSETSRKSRWTAKVVYQESNDYSCQFTAKAQSATSSPLNSPHLKAKGIGNQSSSLPSKITLLCDDSPSKSQITLGNKATCSNYVNVQYLLDQLDEQNERNMKSLETLESDIPDYRKSPPPPPPRNPNRKVWPTHSSASGLRPYSYSLDVSSYDKSATNGTDVLAPSEKLPESCSYQPEEQASRACRENNIRNKYSADSRPKSRTPIQMTSCSAESKAHSPSYKYDECKSVLNDGQNFNSIENETARYTENDIFLSSSSDRLDQMNEIGIPVFEKEYDPHPLGSPVAGRPLSMVIEKSESDIAASDVEFKEFCKPIRNRKNGNKEGKKSNLEDALFELEEIYKSLRLSDEDLLDRADRREVTSAVQNKRQNFRFSWGGLNGYQSEPILYSGRRYSSVEYLPINELRHSRSKSSRKSAVPDMVADDMAYRKLRKSDNPNVASTCNIVSRAGSFLLMSPTFSPPPFFRVATPTSPNEPDVTLDDVVFRNVRQSNNTLKVQDPQPPFGIPIGPISPAADSDYLHAKPENLYRSTFRPRRSPDVVKDDLAFRMLRKDILTNNPNTEYTGRFIKADHYAYKKRRAVRSLSANIASLMEKGSRTPYVESQKHALDLNSNILTKENRCTSFNNMPDILAQFGNSEGTCRTIPDIIRRQSPPKLSRDMSFSESLKNDFNTTTSDGENEDKYLSLIASEAKQITEELNKKLYNLRQETENIPKKSNEAFVKKIVHHKPITLSQFNIQDISKSNPCPQNGVSSSNNVTGENINKRDTKEWSDLFNERKKAFTSHLKIQLRRSPEKMYITSNNLEESVKDAEIKDKNSEIGSDVKDESCSTNINGNFEDKENLGKDDLNTKNNSRKSKNTYNNHNSNDGNFLKNLCGQETSSNNENSCIGNCFPSGRK